jgi:hypothetical protein
MHLLTIGTPLAELHQQAFTCGEQSIHGEVPLHCGRMHLHPLDQFGRSQQDFINGKKDLGKNQSAVGGIVKCTLQKGIGGILPENVALYAYKTAQ